MTWVDVDRARIAGPSRSERRKGETGYAKLHYDRVDKTAMPIEMLPRPIMWWADQSWVD